MKTADEWQGEFPCSDNKAHETNWIRAIQRDAIASLEQDKAILDWLASLNYVTCNNTVLLNNPILNEGETRAMRLRQACLKAMKGNEFVG